MAFLTHRRIVSWSAVVLLTVAARAAPAAESDPVPEDQVKAAFLFNFLKFVEWPEQKNRGPWVIGVVGGGEFANLLEETVRDRMVNGRAVLVHRFRHTTDIRDCQLVFFPRTEAGSRVVPALRGVLAVGESPGFIGAGGAINLYVEASRVRFEISPEAARAAGLRISPQLLKLGTVR